MPDPLLDHGDLTHALRLVAGAAESYLAGIDEARVSPPGHPQDPGDVRTEGLPADGVGSLAALSELIKASLTAPPAPPVRGSFTS